MEQPTLYAESGGSWWPVLVAPALTLLGVLVDALSDGLANVTLWLFVGLALLLATAVWVNGRRRARAVRLTPKALHLGREELSVAEIASAVAEPRAGARVLGGGWALPRGVTEVPLRLTDGTVVSAWAADPAGLQAALVKLLALRA
ncbi:hypothetical protein GCM10022243_62770 [Saccharothrix violaceirubra]|uniref:DUF3093 family protein n=1 Tax=Saccharothrix violaceirubra TaxID=413306 RepID=A0A7W7WT14_9PSEU|nr:hypothetical protein [Saccharothrix violaceirubra]MBB4962776.1 hypothetical protein [Saccharothrix violaceirubra]